jgi:hypothetical protein
MFLTRLVYASSISDDFSCDDIEHILAEARTHNKENNVTGMLCFNNKYFLQCIEGSRLNVNSTYHKILNDKRHCNIVLLEYKEISMREFGCWSMGYMHDSSLTASLNLKYSGSADFSPYDMSGEGAHLMMMELKDLTAPVS